MPTNHGLKKSGGEEGGKEFPKQSGFPPIDRVRETWIVVADNLSQTYQEILETDGIPGEGETRGLMACKSVMARFVDPDALLWEVDVEWDSRVDGQGGEGDNPVDWTPVVRWGTETMELPLQFDPVTGAPIENGVGEPFFITGPVSIPVRMFTRYEDHDVVDYYDDLILQYGDHTNSTNFRGWPPYTVLLAGIEAEPASIRGARFARVTYVTKYLARKAPNTYIPRREYPSDPQTPVVTMEIVGWKESLLNQGTKYLESAGDPIDEAEPFLDAHGNPTVGNLNVDGTRMPSTFPGIGNVSPNFLRFFRHPTADLNDLQI